VDRVKACYDQLEESNDFLASGKWLSAAQGFQKALNLIRYLPVVNLTYQSIFYL
jgi:hypothetical protein